VSNQLDKEPGDEVNATLSALVSESGEQKRYRRNTGDGTQFHNPSSPGLGGTGMVVQPVIPAMLYCYPQTPSTAVQRIKAFPRLQEKVLVITYVVNGDIQRLRLPPAKAPHPAPGLWQHTCFEAFVGAKVSPAYYELNFAPSGEWAAYSFRRYRDSFPLENDHLEPRIALRRQADELELTAEIRLRHLPAVPAHGSLRLGLAAVMEDTAGGLSYWSLRHSGGKPDFHDPDSFILQFSRG
jgi:hypothetical protein